MSELGDFQEALRRLASGIREANPRAVSWVRRAADISASLTPRWPAPVRAGIGTFGLGEGLVASNTPGGEYLGLAAAMFGLWLLLGALRDTA